MTPTHQKTIYERSNRVVYELDGKHVLKIGTGNPNEAETMKFVRENTTLPVPEDIDYWTYDEKNYILMEKVPGVTLESVWSTLSPEEKECILVQVKYYVQEIRKFEFSHIGVINRMPTMTVRMTTRMRIRIKAKIKATITKVSTWIRLDHRKSFSCILIYIYIYRDSFGAIFNSR